MFRKESGLCKTERRPLLSAEWPKAASPAQYCSIKTATGKTFNFIKNSKLGTNKLSKKISGFVSRKTIKIKKFRNNINSMTNDLENANKRR